MTQVFIFHDSEVTNYRFVFLVKFRAENVKHLIRLLVKLAKWKEKLCFVERSNSTFLLSGNVHLV